MPVRFHEGWTEVVFGGGDVHLGGRFDGRAHVVAMGTGPAGAVGRAVVPASCDVPTQVVLRFPCLGALDTVIGTLSELRADMLGRAAAEGGAR